MNYTYKNIWLINFPVMMSILIEQLINITDAIFLGHVGEIELGASALAGIWYLAIYMLGFGFSLGLQVVIARRIGAGFQFLDAFQQFFISCDHLTHKDKCPHDGNVHLDGGLAAQDG